MKPVTIVLLVILVVLIAALVVLYFLGRRAEKRKSEQDAQIAAAAQQVNMLIIDKKRLRIKEAGLPPIVLEQTPWYLKRSKLPIVKAKVGPRVMTLIAADEIYDIIPLKKEVKATVSGLYITNVRGLRGPLEKPVEQKKGFKAKFTALYNKAKAKAQPEEQQSAKKGKKK